MNTTDMLYEGNVELALKINGNIYKLKKHNSGTNYLKQLFAKVLVDPSSVSTSEAPGYLAIYKFIETETGSEEVALTIRDIPLTGKALVDLSTDNYYTAASFTGYIGYEHISEVVDPTDTSRYCIYLLTNDIQINGVDRRLKLASFDVSPEILSYISPGITATVNWTLRLINKNENKGA